MRTSHRPRVARLALSSVITAGALTGVAFLPAAAAVAQTSATVATTCTDESTPPVAVQCPTIVSVTVGSAWIRSSKTTPITFPVTVVVDDPADIAVEMDTVMGRGLDRAEPIVVVGDGYALSPTSVSEFRKTFTMTVTSPYTPLFPDGATPPYGGFQINPVVWGADPAADPLAEAYRSGSIKALSVVTNTPSATSVRKGQWFTVAGKLTRFDGTPQGGQKVNVYYVPAGQTRASFAGSPTTSSTGAFSLPVRSWFTGSWFVNYPGSVFSTGVYKAVWVKVS